MNLNVNYQTAAQINCFSCYANETDNLFTQHFIPHSLVLTTGSFGANVSSRESLNFHVYLIFTGDMITR